MTLPVNGEEARIQLIEGLINLDRAVRTEDTEKLDRFDALYDNRINYAKRNFAIDTTHYLVMREKILERKVGEM